GRRDPPRERAAPLLLRLLDPRRGLGEPADVRVARAPLARLGPLREANRLLRPRLVHVLPVPDPPARRRAGDARPARVAVALLRARPGAGVLGAGDRRALVQPGARRAGRPRPHGAALVPGRGLGAARSDPD